MHKLLLPILLFTSIYSCKNFNKESSFQKLNQDSIYQVTLAVTATGGCTDTITQPVEVFPLPNASITAANVCFEKPFRLGIPPLSTQAT